MNAFDLVVFDLDGTLVDSRRDLADSVNALLDERGAPPLPEGVIGAMVGDGAKQLVERAFASAGIGDDGGALARFLELYDARLVVHTRPYDGMAAALEVIAGRGMKRAVFTNKPQAAANRVLAALDLARWFDAGVLGAEGTHPRKPDPAGLLWLVHEAGADISRALLVGDASQDVETARRAGARVCVARYGFGFPTAEAILDGTEILIDSPADLPSKL
ncbi:MAG: HAD hydrolase-like protein [Acidobacteria bacterium]|nr:HAD hydrolase-like protein [Acidobacteriota bacterium]